MVRKKKKVVAKRSPAPPRKMRTDDLCKALAGIAAFHVTDPHAQMKIYEAVRRLQMLDKVATEAGILPPRT